MGRSATAPEVQLVTGFDGLRNGQLSYGTSSSNIPTTLSTMASTAAIILSTLMRSIVPQTERSGARSRFDR